jgi:hypothetical protein
MEDTGRSGRDSGRFVKRGTMRTYKDNQGDPKEIQKVSELKVQRNLWKIWEDAEDPGQEIHTENTKN